MKMKAMVSINNEAAFEVNVPKNVKGKYENVAQYGIQALQNRILRTRVAKQAAANGDVFNIRSIEYRGNVVTQW
jgi:hypothetical protein